MDRANISYSLKNIPYPSNYAYKSMLVRKTVDFIDRFRKRIYWIKNPAPPPSKETFGFKSNWKPPVDPDLSKFESDLWNIIEHIKFKPPNGEFQGKLSNDLNTMKTEGKILMKGDKSSKLYKVEPQDYKNHLRNNVTSLYSKCSHDKVEEVNNHC